MALTVFETSEQVQQLLPCQKAVEQGDGGRKAAAGAEKAAVTLKETDRGGDGDRPERDDIWNMIQAQAQKPAPKQAHAQAPYVHPLVRRSSSLLTQKSMEICTESLGSETGSDGFSDADSSSTDRSCPGSDDDERAEEVAPRATPPRAFPPPLPSLARRKVVESTTEMKQERKDGRLLVKVVPVESSTLFHAQRRGGRLVLSFADTAAPASDELDKSREQLVEPEHHADEHDANEEDEEDEVEEEVEVVDRGTVVEFNVSTQPQARSGSGPRVHRSSLAINKFVDAEPVATCELNGGAAPAAPQEHPPKAPRRFTTGSTTTAVAALAAASVLSATAPSPGNGDDAVPGATCGENKLLMTAKRRSSKEELLNNMRRCNQLNGKKLFFWEPRIATSS